MNGMEEICGAVPVELLRLNQKDFCLATFQESKSLEVRQHEDAGRKRDLLFEHFCALRIDLETDPTPQDLQGIQVL